MSRSQRVFLATLALATFGVFLVVGWLAYDDSLLESINIGAGVSADDGSEDTDTTVWAIGDSLMVAASGVLKDQSPDIVIDAEVGRRIAEGIGVLEDMLAAGQPDVLIIALGTNNGATTEEIDAVMVLAQDIDTVVFVNVAVPRTWETETNAALVYARDNYSNTTVVNWNAASKTRTDLFRSDGYHLSAAGSKLWVELITAEATN
jgi:hypothetical protein